MLVLLGYTPVVIFLKDDPIVPLLYIPCAVTLYTIPQCSELTVTIAIPLMIGALPEIAICVCS